MGERFEIKPFFLYINLMGQTAKEFCSFFSLIFRLRRTRGIFFFLCILFLSGLLSAQTLPFRNYTEKDGLPELYVYSICQDSRGYLWFGTRYGLSRFDGKEFVNFKTKDGLPDACITAIIEDRSGHLWIGTHEGGVSRLALSSLPRVQFKNYSRKDGLADNYIWEIVEDNDGIIWFGTDKGLSRFDGKNFETYNTIGELDSKLIRDIAVGKDGKLWLATSEGVGVLTKKGFTRYTTADGLVSNNVFTLLPDSKGRCWIGTTEGLSCFQKGIFSSYTTKEGLIHDHVKSIIEARDGKIWVGTWQGVSVFTGGKFSGYTTRNGLVGNYINFLLEDSEGNIWHATGGGGVSRLNCSRMNITTYSVNDGLISNNISVIKEDRQKRYWIGTQEGLTCLCGGDVKRYSQKDGLASDSVSDIAIDRRGNAWIATLEGLSVFSSSGKLTNYTMEDGLASNILYKLIEARDGTIWICTKQGITRYKNGTFSPPPFKASDVKVLNILEDSNGNLWFAAAPGLYQFSVPDNVLTYYSTRDGLPDNYIQSMFEDSRGRLWIGTENGLGCKENGRFRNYTTKHGLPDNLCKFILEDNEGDLWIGTPSGLVCFDGEAFKTYTTRRHGLAGNSWNSGFKDSRGALWFGSSHGITRFTLPLEGSNPVPPPIYITNLSVVGEDVPLAPSHQLDYDRNHLRIGFVGLCYTAPESVTYRFRMLGVDSQWQETKERSVPYPYLPSGTFRFQVKAVNNDDLESSEPAELLIRISPPFWKTWWFLALSFFMALSGIGALFFWRSKRLEEKMTLEVKEMALEARTRQLVMSQRMELMGILAAGAVHDLKSLMGIIIGYSKMVVKKFSPEDANYKHLGRIKSTATTAVQVVAQILAFARQKHDETVAADLGKLLEDLLETLQISTPDFVKISWEPPEEKILLRVNPTRFQQVVMNLCLNSVHAMPRGGQLTVSLKSGRGRDNGGSDNKVLLNVTDTGTGIKKENLERIFDPLFTTKEQGVGTGLGLFVVKQIVEEHNGEIAVSSEPGKGTTICVSFDRTLSEKLVSNPNQQ